MWEADKLTPITQALRKWGQKDREVKHILAAGPGLHGPCLKTVSTTDRNGKKRKAHSCVRMTSHNQPVLCTFTLAKVWTSYPSIQCDLYSSPNMNGSVMPNKIGQLFIYINLFSVSVKNDLNGFAKDLGNASWLFFNCTFRPHRPQLWSGGDWGMTLVITMSGWNTLSCDS